MAGGGYDKVDELARKPRSMQEMTEEAEEYKKILSEMMEGELI